MLLFFYTNYSGENDKLSPSEVTLKKLAFSCSTLKSKSEKSQSWLIHLLHGYYYPTFQLSFDLHIPVVLCIDTVHLHFSSFS